MLTLEAALETTPDAARRALYRKVLACYDRAGAASRRRGGTVWCCDPAAADIACDYAVRTGRDVIQTAGPAVFPELSGAESVTLIGRTDIFPTSALLDLVEGLRLPWGVLTGDDLASLAFACLKSLGAWQPERAQPAQIVLDRINGHAARHSGFDQPAEPLSFDAAVLRDLLRTGAAQAVFHAHGEGAHCNFDPLVVCGRTGVQEMGRNGAALAGCADGAAGITCKRAAPGAALLLRDVPTPLLWLFTCNGISLAGEHYPSDLSLARASIEGYVAAMVSTLFPVYNSQAEIARIAGKLRAGMLLSALTQEENDRRRAVGLAAPWVLLGDAACAGQGAGHRPERRDGHRQAPQPAEPTGAKHIAATDTAATDIAATEQDTRAGLLAITQAEDLLLNIKRLSLDADGQALLSKLDRLRQDLSVTLRLLMRAQTIATQFGGVETERDLLAALRDQLVAAWEELLAALVHDHLAFADHDRLWSDGLAARATRTRDPCPRCGSGLWRKGHYLPLADADAAAVFAGESRSCPVCGPVSYRTAGFRAALAAELPRVARQRAELTLNVALAEADARPGRLILGLRDKSRGKQVWIARHAMTRPRLEIKLPVPPDMGLDLHTLRIVFLSGLEMTAVRLRVAVLPEGRD